MNDIALHGCGYTRGEVLDRPFWEAPWWRASEEVKARIRFAVDQAAAGIVFREELPYWVADGDQHVVEFAIHPIRDRSGAVRFLHPTGIDITERKRIEAALRDSEQRLSWLAALVESSDDAITSTNLDGIITSWNRGAERMYGYTAGEAIGRPMTMVVPPDRHEEERTILARIRRGEHIEPFETVRRSIHGAVIVVLLTVSPVKTADGVIVGASKIARTSPSRRGRRSRSRRSPARPSTALARRFLALANVNSLFVESHWIGAELTQIAAQELAPYSATNERPCESTGRQVLLEPNAAQILAVALHELATNAAKYGALSSAEGRVHLAWTHSADGRLELRWTETGGPAVRSPARQGFGTRIITQMVGQLKGGARFDWGPEGLCCAITLQT